MRQIKKRNSSVEGLRILSMFLIIMFHFCGRGLGLSDIASYSAANLGGANDNVLLQLIMHSLGQLGVPIFLFISGYYSIRFKANRLKDIIIQCFLYTFVFYILFCLFVPEIRSFRVSVLQMFGMSQLWFVYSYIVLYLFSDGINHVLDNLSFKQYTMIVLLLLYITTGLWIAKAGGTNILIMLEYYTIARYVRKYMSEKWKGRMVWFTFPALIMFLTPVLVGCFTNHVAGIQPYVNKYFNPFLLLLSMTLVVSADTIKTYSKPVNYVASSMLAVYMIHESAYLPTLVTSLFGLEEYNFIRICGVIIMIILVAVAVDKMRLLVTNKIFNKEYL
ncbi:MAG: acyltransferase family protein [Paraprevotella sp.]|nr:acyltransferase family protein [Paraprevotella sp.]